MEIRTVTEGFAVSPQVSAEDLAGLREQGYTLVINNRPDGEAPDQPAGSSIATAARAAGLNYVAIPVSSAGFQMPQVDEMARALACTEGKTLAFCRTGTRSIMLWALAEAKCGGETEKIAEEVAKAGYDATPIRATMETLAAGRG